MKKILISLIHNNDKDRLSYIRPLIKELELELQKKYEVESCEFSYQPKPTPVSTQTALLKDFMYWKLDRDWNTYKKVRNTFIVRSFLSFLKKILLKYLLSKNSSLEKWKIRCAIEMYITSKHVRAFKYLLENNYDYLICFEDDTIFETDSIKKTFELINDLELKHSKEDLLYVDLAGGCDLSELKYEALKIKTENGLIHYSKPVTNTVCCYLINRAQITNLDFLLMRNPILQYLNTDWFINKIFTLQDNSKLMHVRTIHTFPPIFKHGSAVGERKVTY